MKLSGVVEFKCPFCGRRAFASENPQTLGHDLPPCEQYMKLSPVDYLKAVNKAYGNRK